MECKDAEQLIPFYIESGLSSGELEQFVEHVKTCSSCYEELEINYLIQVGLLRLEDGISFDLHAELLNRLRNSEKKVEIKNKILFGIYIIEIAAGLSLLVTLATWLLGFGV